jgi:hypothetical protein
MLQIRSRKTGTKIYAVFARGGAGVWILRKRPIFARSVAIVASGTSATNFPFKKVAQAQFCHRKPVGFQRLPNQLALQPDSGIIISRRCIADKICHWSHLPLGFLFRFCFARLRANSMEKQYRKVKFFEAKT